MTDPSVSITRCAQPGMPSPGCRRRRARGATVARTVAVRATVPPSRYPPGGRPSRQGRPLLAGRVPARIDAWLGAGCQARPARPGDLTGRAEWRVDACGPGRQASPPRRPAPGRPPPPPATAGPRRGHRPGPRARPCRPSPPAGPGRPPAPPRRTARRAAFRSLPRSPGRQPRAAAAAAGRAGAGLDAAGGAERPSSRTHGRAAPGNAQPLPAGPPPPRTQTPGTPDDPLLTIEEVIAELRVSRAAFYRWRRQGAGPAVVRLPGGGVRVRRSALTEWLRRLEEDTTADRSKEQMDSYDVRFWDIKKLGQRQRRPGTGSGGPSTAASTASRSRPGPSPTGSSTTSRTRSATGGPSTRAPACPPPRPPRDEMVTWYEHARSLRRGQVARASPRSPAGRSPRRWSPSPSP